MVFHSRQCVPLLTFFQHRDNLELDFLTQFMDSFVIQAYKTFLEAILLDTVFFFFLCKKIHPSPKNQLVCPL